VFVVCGGFCDLVCVVRDLGAVGFESLKRVSWYPCREYFCGDVDWWVFRVVVLLVRCVLRLCCGVVD